MTARLILVEPLRRLARRLKQLPLFAGAPPAPVDCQPEPEPPRLLTAQEYQTRKSLLDDSEVLVLGSVERLFRDTGTDRLPLRKWLIKNEGRKPRTAERRLQALCRVGLLLVAEPGGGRGNATVYALAYQSPGPRQIQKPDKAVVVFGPKNPDTNPDTFSASAALSPYTAEKRVEAKEPKNPDRAVGVLSTSAGDALVLAHYPTTKPHVLAQIRGERHAACVSDEEYAQLVREHGDRLRIECDNPVLWSRRLCDKLAVLRATARLRSKPVIDNTQPSARPVPTECPDCVDGWRTTARGDVSAVERCHCKGTRR